MEPNNSSLIIHDIRRTDEGLYQCSAWEGVYARFNSLRIEVVVQCKQIFWLNCICLQCKRKLNCANIYDSIFVLKQPKLFQCAPLCRVCKWIGLPNSSCWKLLYCAGSLIRYCNLWLGFYTLKKQSWDECKASECWCFSRVGCEGIYRATSMS